MKVIIFPSELKLNDTYDKISLMFKEEQLSWYGPTTIYRCYCKIQVQKQLMILQKLGLRSNSKASFTVFTFSLRLRTTRVLELLDCCQQRNYTY